jgi:hypothetical protein
VSKQNKNSLSLANFASAAVQDLGIYAMAIATTVGMLQLGDKPNSRIIIPGQPSFAMANELNDELNNPIRREKEEETAAHSMSFSVVQRTQSRAGKR